MLILIRWGAVRCTINYTLAFWMNWLTDKSSFFSGRLDGRAMWYLSFVPLSRSIVSEENPPWHRGSAHCTAGMKMLYYWETKRCRLHRIIMLWRDVDVCVVQGWKVTQVLHWSSHYFLYLFLFPFYSFIFLPSGDIKSWKTLKNLPFMFFTPQTEPFSLHNV